MSAPGSHVTPVEMATFTFAADEPEAGQEGVVMAYVVRHARGILLFDTGFGFGSLLVDERYRPRARGLPDALATIGLSLADIGTVVNCHLHIDHGGQNHRLPGVPIHAQPAEWELVQRGGHTINEWIDFAGANYQFRAGDYELFEGIRVLATPGHTAGHQSLAVQAADGLVLLAGQACYSAGEWAGQAGAIEGRFRAPDQAAYDRSLVRLRQLRPVRVHFGHDRATWTAREPAQPTNVESEGRARRGTSGALYLQTAPAGLNPLPRPASADADGAIDVEDRVPRSGDA